MVVTLGQQYDVGEKSTVILYTYINRHAGTPQEQQKQKQCYTSSNMVIIMHFYIGYLKKNQKAPRPSEHPPVRGGEMSKRLGGIKGCKYKTSSWHINGFPDGNNIGSTVSCRGEAHRYTVLIAMQGHWKKQ